MATRGAKVLTVGALADFKSALVKFGEHVNVALIEANADIVKTLNRLQGEMVSRWQHEIKVWTRKVAEAKSELYRVQLQSGEERPSAVLERKALQTAQRKLDEAQQKIQRIRYWTRAIEKERMICRGQLQQLDRVIEGDLPRVLAQVDRMMNSLDAYLRVKPTVAASEERRETASESTPAAAGSADEAVEAQADTPDQAETETNGTDRDQAT